MNKLVLLTLLLTPSAFAQYKMVIFTDAETKSKANEFKNYLVGKPPFNKLDPKDYIIKTVVLSKAEMDCANRDPKTPRVISCNEELLHRKKAQEEAHLAMAFTNNAEGGSGGSIPKASKNYPIQTMLHEILHTFGCHDEYEYSTDETQVYCENVTSNLNAAFFADTPPYGTDPDARRLHSRDIPWFSKIEQSTLITTNRNLGTPDNTTRLVPGSQVAGLYAGGSCTKKIKTWKPYKNSIMNGYEDDTIYPLYEEIITKSMEAQLGRKLKFKPAPAPAASKDENCEIPQALKNDIEDLSDIIRKMTK